MTKLRRGNVIIMEEKVKELSISQFAKYCGTTRQTLQHYDKIGILRPSLIGEQGYRYYEHMQSYDFRLICALKNIGCSLDEIRDMMNNHDDESISKTLASKRKAIDDEIAKLRLSRMIINNTEKFMNIIKHFTASPSFYTLDENMTCGLFSFSHPVELEGDDYRLEQQYFSEFSVNIPSPQLHPNAFVVPKSEFESGSYGLSHIVYYDYLNVSSGQKYVLEKGRYLVIKTDMKYPYTDSRREAYTILKNYMAENKLTCKGDVYEVPAKALITLQVSKSMPVIFAVPIAD